jgi:chaperonin GroES
LDEKGQRIAMNVKAGDRVLYGKYSGSEVKLGEEELMIMHEEDIFGVLEG